MHRIVQAATLASRSGSRVDRNHVLEALSSAFSDALAEQYSCIGETDKAVYARLCLPHAIKICDRLRELSTAPAFDFRAPFGFVLQTVSTTLRELGRYPQAHPLQLFVIDLRRRALGEKHTDTLKSVRNLAVLLQTQGKFDEA